MTARSSPRAPYPRPLQNVALTRPRRRPQTISVLICSLEVYVLADQFPIRDSHVEIERHTIPAHLDMVRTRRQVENRGSGLRLLLAIEKDRSTRRSRCDAQRSHCLVEFHKQVVVLRDRDDFRKG